MPDATGRARTPRVPTGIPGLDEVLRGGLFRGGVYIVMGSPGAGKTILGNQLAFAHARGGGRVVYATLLSETHGRLLDHIGALSFFDGALVGDAITYLSGLPAVEGGGLDGLQQLVRTVVRERAATLLVVDGLLGANALAEREVQYKKFVQQLQAWIEVMGCTVVALSSAREVEVWPEYTMVDGIVELEYARVGRRRVRELTVRKLRGTGFAEGAHSYQIDADGIRVFPRLETSVGGRPRAAAGPGAPELSFGRPELDHLLGGGLARCSSTLVLGGNGTGKTTLGMHFLAAALDAGEPALHFSFYEDAPAVVENAERLGLRFAERLGDGLEVRWLPSAELLLDRVGYEILEAVRRSGAKRVLVDGLQAFGRSAYPERLPAYFSALVQELRALDVTSILTSEAPHLLAGDFESPFPGLSAVVDNIVLLLQTEADGRLVRAIAVPKTRARPHAARIVRFELGPTGIEVDAADAPRRERRGLRTGGGGARGRGGRRSR